MKRLLPPLFASLLLLLLAGACTDSLFNEELPGFPQFKADVTAIDFGRVEVLTEAAPQAVTILNLGAPGSRMYVYAYVAGNPAFRLTNPMPDAVELVGGGGQPLVAGVTFAPQRTGAATGELVIYSSDRPLSEDIHVSTYRIPLAGYGTTACSFPGTPDGQGVSLDVALVREW